MSYWNELQTRRMSRRRVLASTAAIGGGAVLLAACGGDDENGTSTGGDSGLVSTPRDETSKVKKGGVYKASLGADLFNLEPQSLGGATVTTFLGYTGLLREKDGFLELPTGELVGDVARSWEVSPDRTSVTFKINPDAHFAPLPPVNGRSVDAEDIVASWKRFSTVSNRRFEFVNGVNPSAPIVSMQATDSQTVVTKLAYPYAPILGLLGVNSLGTFFIVPKEALDPSVLNVTKTPIGTGPFYMSNWEPSVKVEFKRNPGFKQIAGDFPYVDQVDMPIVPEYAAGLAQFKTGAIYSYNVLAADVVQTKKDAPDIQLTQTSPVSSWWRTMFGNRDGSPFRDERVRQAYVFTWDREAVLDAAYNVSRYAADGLEVQIFYESALQCDNWKDWLLDARDEQAFGKNAEYFKHDLARAKQLMSAAGYKDGLKTSVHYPDPPLSPAWGNLNQVITQMVEDSGLFRITRESHNFITDFTPNFQASRGNFDGIAHYFLGLHGDPTFYVSGTLSSGGSLFTMNDSTMDDLISKATREFDEKKRRSLIHEVEQYQGGKQFMPRLGGGTGFSMSWPVLRNFGVFRGHYQDFRTMFLDPEQRPLKS